MKRILASWVIGACAVMISCGGATSKDTGDGARDVPSTLDGAGGDTPTDTSGRLDSTSPDTAIPPDVPVGDNVTSLDLPILDIPAVPGCPVCGVGGMTGLACAPDGKSVVPDVTVSVDGTDCHGQAFHIETQSSPTGRYSLENVPCGYQVVQLNKGSYSHEFDVFIRANEVVEPTTGRCFEGTAAKIAVITGDWDHIEYTLDKLKLKYTTIDGVSDEMSSSNPAFDFLEDWNELSKYNILFVNCGRDQDTGSTAVNNLRKFVDQGGSFYGSDYAISYIMAAWPNAVVLPSDAYEIFNETLQADVRDPRLGQYLQKAVVTLQYVLGPMVAVESAGDGTEVHIEGIFKQLKDDQVRPMMLSFRPNGDKGGRVVYTDFHNESLTGQAALDFSAILKFIVFML